MSWQSLPKQPIEDQREHDRAFYMDSLHALVHAGVHIAQTLELRATNATIDGSDAAIDAAEAFERVARAVRRTIMLATKLAQPEPEPASPPAQRPPAQRPSNVATRPAPECAPERLDRDRPEHPGSFPDDQGDTTPGPRPEPEDRLETPAEESLLHLPIPQQLAAIRRDLDPIGTRQPKG